MLIRLQLNRAAYLPLDHQDLLAGLVYRLLAKSDEEYARFLHNEGYGLPDAGSRRYKLFVFSGLRAPKSRRRVEGRLLRLAPGEVTWLLGSPMSDFLTHSATGLFAAGQAVHVGEVALTVTSLECLPQPDFRHRTRFTCLSPIVAAVPREEGGTRYLTPADGAAFSEAVRRNLVRKFTLAQGEPPPDASLVLEFDAEYLARSSGTKLVTFKGVEIKGAFAPFTLRGSTELMRAGWECGLGEKNSGGFGMVEIAR